MIGNECRGGKAPEVNLVDHAKDEMVTERALFWNTAKHTPDYLEIDSRHLSAKFVRAPELAEVPYPVRMEPNLVVEYYAS